MGAITPGAFALDTTPLDSPLYVLDGVGDPLVISGSGIFIELQAYNTSTLVVETLRFATDGYSDPTAPGYFSPRMIQSLNFRRDMFGGNTTGGPNRVSFGELRLANDDGGLDTLRATYAFAGWPASLKIGDPSQLYTTFETLITGKPQQVFFNSYDLSITMRDRLQDFSQPVQTHKYLGDNIMPNGLEGGDDLKDKPKPLLFGRVQNIPPILVNSSKLIFQVSDLAVADVSAVYDQGVALTRAADYVSSADMIATQPSPGQYRCYLAGGYFRLGASPVGTITCDAADTGIYGSVEQDLGNTAAQVAIRIAVRPIDSGEGGILSSDIESSDVAELDRRNSATVGIWLADQTSFSSALDAVLGSVGAWYGWDRLGKFRMQRLEVPAGFGVCTFRMFGPDVDAGITDYDIIDVRFLPTNDPDRGIPTYEVSLDYSLNYTVQKKDNLGGAVSDVRIEFLETAKRTVKATNSTLKTAYPLAAAKTVTTLLLSQSAAQTEADRLLAMYQTQRDFIEIDTPMVSELVATVDIGREVFLALPRFNYAAGKAMTIIGMQYNPGTRGLTLALWG